MYVINTYLDVYVIHYRSKKHITDVDYMYHVGDVIRKSNCE